MVANRKPRRAGARDAQRRAVGPGEPAALAAENFRQSPQPAVRRSALQLLEMAGLPAKSDEPLRRAAAIAQDRTADPELRADEIGLLAIGGSAPRQAMLQSLIDAKEPEAVQAAAVQALGKISGDDIGRLLLANWRAFPAPARAAAGDAMYLEPGRVKLLAGGAAARRCAALDAVLPPQAAAHHEPRCGDSGSRAAAAGAERG